MNGLFQTNIVQSLLRGLDPIHQKAVSLTPGQVFNGKITKLYPGQLASLQLGGLTLTAKLEAALTAGNRYWFQVQPGEGIPVLKVLEANGELRNSSSGDSDQALRQLGLNNTRINEMLVNHLAKEEVPFYREHVKNGAQTLKEVGMVNERGLSTLQVLIERNLPITTNTFLAMQSVIDGQGLSLQLDELFELLQRTKVKQPALQQLDEMISRMRSEANIKVDQPHVVEMLKSFLSETDHSTKHRQSQNELIKLRVIPNNTSPQQLLAHIKDMLTLASEEQLKNIWPTVSKEEIISMINKDDITRLFNKVVFGTGEKSGQKLQQLLALFSKDFDFAHSQDNSTLTKQLTSMIRLVGYQYERDVSQFFEQQNSSSEKLGLQLKSLLIETRKLDLPSPVLQKIESILHRITGQQLLLSNQESPITNYAVMVPLKLLGTTTDLTIQWEAKKNEDGKLDPNHCRILFYINLNYLKETIVDVQIQNRIVSLNVINQHEKPVKLITALQPILKDALFNLNYQLSSVKWSQPTVRTANSLNRNVSRHSNEFYQSNRSYQGVDIRI